MKKKKKKRKSAKKKGKVARLLASGEEPEPRPEWRRYYKIRKTSVTLRLDADVLAWFREQGPGYQTRINRALRRAMAGESNS